MLLVLVMVVAALPLPPSAVPPSWVEPVPVPTAPVTGGGAIRMLLNDTQVRVDKTVERFDHYAWKVLSQAGVSELAKQEFGWDPSWEQLTLHGVWIWRNGQRRVAWHPEDARVIQREASLDEGIYDGRLTLIVELRDLREGDVVEVASSTLGENPVFQGHFELQHFQTWHEPTDRSFFRLWWNRPRPLSFRVHGGATAPTVTAREAARLYEWNLTNVAGVDLEPSIPADVEPLAWVDFTDWADWGEVAKWAEGLFKVPADGERFETEAARFKALPEGERERAIVRFVQDDIRYVGVELGEHSHQPHSPAWVLERGFGDCKDKSLLLVSLLRAIGLEAWPALVHASDGARLPALAPSPGHFNHAIVEVMLPSGPRFIDPTMTLRRGALETMVQPDYEQALLVKHGVTALVPIPVEPLTAPTWEVEQRWKEGSVAGRAALVITTTARGDEAAVLRRRVQSQTRDELIRNRRKANEASLELELEPVDLTWTDDDRNEVFVFREEYKTEHFFQREKHSFETIAIDRELQPLSARLRLWPLKRWHPQRVREVIVYEAPVDLHGFEFELANKVISHKTFELAVAQRVSGRTLTLEWELRSLADRLLPADVTSYRSAIDEAHAQLSYSVSVTDGEARARADRQSSGAAILALGLMALFGFGLLLRWGDGRQSMKERIRAFQFKAKQRGSPGELAASPALVNSLEAATRLFTTPRCPRGHGWGGVGPSETVRLGDERITVVTRRCTDCDAREDRYVKVTQPS